MLLESCLFCLLIFQEVLSGRVYVFLDFFLYPDDVIKAYPNKDNVPNVVRVPPSHPFS